MHMNKKVIVCIPAGRKRYMEILIQYLLKETDIIDEIRIWNNTTNDNDLSWIDYVHKKYPIIKLDNRFLKTKETGMGGANVYRFYDRCTEEDTVYIKIDDDVVWLKPKFIRHMVECRVNYPEYFLIYGNIINNSVCDYYNKENGMYKEINGFTNTCMCSFSWARGDICEMKHNDVLTKFLEKNKKLPNQRMIELNDKRCSINCISWLGSEFRKFQGHVEGDEEEYFSRILPNKLGKKNCIYGNGYCSHFAFFTQRSHMDSTNILNRYKNLIGI
jgi:hypothetical protein